MFRTTEQLDLTLLANVVSVLFCHVPRSISERPCCRTMIGKESYRSDTALLFQEVPRDPTAVVRFHADVIILLSRSDGCSIFIQIVVEGEFMLHQGIQGLW